MFQQSHSKLSLGGFFISVNIYAVNFVYKKNRICFDLCILLFNFITVVLHGFNNKLNKIIFLNN